MNDLNHPFSHLTRQEVKDLMREAVIAAAKEWMNENFRLVGKWTVRGVTVAAFGALMYFIAHFGGWPKP